MNNILRSICSRRMVAVFILGIVSGLPLLLIGATLKAWLHDEGVDLTTIGLFALVGLPYSLKFLWAPIMDRFVPPFLDRRRGWMLVYQMLLLVSLAVMAFMHPAQHTLLLAGWAVLIAFFSASQDIVIDAYRREILTEEELGFGFSLAINGYRIGMLIASAGALPLADQYGWSIAYLGMAGVMLLGMLTTLWAPTVDPTIPAPASLREAVINPFIEFFRRSGACYILLFILLFKIGEELASEMLNPFYLSLGFSKTQIGLIVKSFGIGSMLVGGLVGGLILLKWSLSRCLLIFGILQTIALLGFSLLAYTGKNLPLLSAVVTAENFTSGMATAALSAYMASLCDKRFTATQYALLSSLFGLSRVFFGSSSGFLAKHLGWEYYFIFCALIAIPGLLLWSWLTWVKSKNGNQPLLTTSQASFP